MAVKHAVLCGSITQDSVSGVIKRILDLNDEKGCDRIELHITSCGGSLYAAFALYNTIHMSQIPVDTVAIGICASSAVTVHQAGAKRFMVPFSTLMIHPTTTGDDSGLSVAEAAVSMEEAKRNDNLIHKMVADRVGMPMSEYLELMGPRRYLNHTEALSLGFIDYIRDIA